VQKAALSLARQSRNQTREIKYHHEGHEEHEVPVARGYQNGDLLAPRRQERQVWKFNVSFGEWEKIPRL
jgi:hypothetical protein